MILWGPPGTGKTTAARLLADETNLAFEQLSAIFSGVQDLRKAFDRAKKRRRRARARCFSSTRSTASTARSRTASSPTWRTAPSRWSAPPPRTRPSSSTAQLLSRALVLVFHRLDEAGAGGAAGAGRGRGGAGRCRSMRRQRETLKAMADGDGRNGAQHGEGDLCAAGRRRACARPGALLYRAVQRRAPLYDKSRVGHYNLISALHKAVRGSDPDRGALLAARACSTAARTGSTSPAVWCAWPIEDIGLAGPPGRVPCPLRQGDLRFLGSPEGELALAQTVIYLADRAEVERGLSRPFGAAMRSAKEHGSLAPPKHILNAPTRLMKEEGYGAGYEYDHSAPEAFSGQNYFPDDMAREQFYAPPAAASRPS
jgi:putative ATPase